MLLHVPSAKKIQSLQVYFISLVFRNELIADFIVCLNLCVKVLRQAVRKAVMFKHHAILAVEFLSLCHSPTI